MSYKNDEFKDVKIGDKLWDLFRGEIVISGRGFNEDGSNYIEWVIEPHPKYPMTVRVSDDGKSCNGNQILFWSKPEISYPPKPEIIIVTKENKDRIAIPPWDCAIEGVTPVTIKKSLTLKEIDKALKDGKCIYDNFNDEIYFLNFNENKIFNYERYKEVLKEKSIFKRNIYSLNFFNKQFYPSVQDNEDYLNQLEILDNNLLKETSGIGVIDDPDEYERYMDNFRCIKRVNVYIDKNGEVKNFIKDSYNDGQAKLNEFEFIHDYKLR